MPLFERCGSASTRIHSMHCHVVWPAAQGSVYSLVDLPIAPSRPDDEAWLLWRCAALITSAGLKHENRRRGQIAKRLFISLKKSVDVTGEFGQKPAKNERVI